MKDLEIYLQPLSSIPKTSYFHPEKNSLKLTHISSKEKRLIGKNKKSAHWDAPPLVVKACQMSRSIQGSPIPKMRSPHLLLLTTVTILGGGSHSHHSHNRGTCLLVHLRFRREEQPCGPENGSWGIMGKGLFSNVRTANM